MREYARKLLDKALDAIEAAELLTNMGKAEIAAGRAYYAMFYTAEALLFNQFDLKLNQHGQVIAAYGKHFAKTNNLTQNITVGCGTALKSVFLEIMAWIQESKKTLQQI